MLFPVRKTSTGTGLLGFLTRLVIGQSVTSPGDWGDRFEFGLTDDLMLAIEPERLQVYRTRNPPDKNLP